MFLICARSLSIVQLGERGFELSLSLIHDDRTHETAPELSGKKTDLLPICLDGLRQDLSLGIQRAKGEVRQAYVRLDSQPYHCEIVRARRRLSRGGFH